MKLFISYTMRDVEISIEFLELLYKKMREIGFVFIDILHNDSQEKQARVIAELESSDYVFLIETPRVYSSQWVRYELERASNLNIPIISLPYSQIVHLV